MPQITGHIQISAEKIIEDFLSHPWRPAEQPGLAIPLAAISKYRLMHRRTLQELIWDFSLLREYVYLFLHYSSIKLDSYSGISLHHIKKPYLLKSFCSSKFLLISWSRRSSTGRFNSISFFTFFLSLSHFQNRKDPLHTQSKNNSYVQYASLAISTEKLQSISIC